MVEGKQKEGRGGEQSIESTLKVVYFTLQSGQGKVLKGLYYTQARIQEGGGGVGDACPSPSSDQFFSPTDKNQENGKKEETGKGQTDSIISGLI